MHGMILRLVGRTSAFRRILRMPPRGDVDFRTVLDHNVATMRITIKKTTVI